MTQEDEDLWFRLTLKDAERPGVEVTRLARLLNNLSTAFFAIARSRRGGGAARPGPRSAAEEALAGFRVLRVIPGSTAIELLPPPADAQLPLFDEVTADDVAFDFYNEIDAIEAGEPPLPGRWDVRRYVRAVLDDAAEIGPTAEIAYRPRSPRPEVPSVRVLKKSFSTRELPQLAVPERSTRVRHLTGHTYMVDVEPGRQRIRVKLPDGRDLTLEVEEGLAARLAGALDRAVEIEVEEEVEGELPAKRVARELDILPSSGEASDRPSKSIQELESEQGLPKARPDYVALASAVWRTKKELIDFEAHLRDIRRVEGG